jgi:hypothetical protein
MDLGPISGIPTIVLPNAQKAKREGTPDFEIAASKRSGDEPPNDQNPPQQRAREQEQFHPSPNQPGLEPSLSEASAGLEIDCDGQHDWFV